jgi:hypothetical protein
MERRPQSGRDTSQTLENRPLMDNSVRTQISWLLLGFRAVGQVVYAGGTEMDEREPCGC